MQSLAWEWKGDLLQERATGEYFRKQKGISLGTNETKLVKWVCPTNLVLNGLTYAITNGNGLCYAENPTNGVRELTDIMYWDFPDHRTAVEVVSIYPSAKCDGGAHAYDAIEVTAEDNTLYIVDEMTGDNYLVFCNIGLYYKYEGREPKTSVAMRGLLKALLKAGLQE